MGVAVLRALVPWLSLAILSFAVAGCATTEQQTAAAVNGRILDDKFRPYREFQTGEIRVANTVGTGAKRLVARVDRKTGKATWILSFVIAYDQPDSFAAPRVWWTFRSFGHHRVAVLDGGLAAWMAAGNYVMYRLVNFRI